jgi:hypothetical protein
MSWSWSHTDEAYAAAETNLRALPLETLREIHAEWCATDTQYDHPDSDYSGFSHTLFVQAMENNATIPADTLADTIWDAAQTQATCDNGGHTAWLCPHGCGPHCVPFNQDT